MPTERHCIVGAGGHARVVADALLCAGVPLEALCFADDRPDLHGRTLLGAPVIGPVASVAAGMAFHVAIGDAQVRERLQRQLVSAGARPLTVVHPRAVLSASATLGAGAFVAATAVIAPLARVGEGAIVNHAAVVDHDCEVGSWSHVAPHATLGGNVRIGAAVLIGANATVLPGLRVGARATVGAGAVVVADVAEGVICRGVPARAVER
jgi:sugar O-acyltransferase (sialic acid O-acetyltransferase NeuD family)